MEHHTLIGVDGDMVDGTVPEFFVEGQWQGIQFAQFIHHAADGDEQFPLGVEGHDIFFLEEALTAGLLQLADGGQAVHGVSREVAYTLGHNQVDFSGKGIPDHAVEAVPALGVDGADALVGVNLHEVPVGVLLDEPGVVIHLGFICMKVHLCLPVQRSCFHAATR